MPTGKSLLVSVGMPRPAGGINTGEVNLKKVPKKVQVGISRGRVELLIFSMDLVTNIKSKPTLGLLSVRNFFSTCCLVSAPVVKSYLPNANRIS